jgi:zinc protease
MAWDIFSAKALAKPEDLELLLNTMRDLADKFATGGATEDELDRALKPTLGQLEKSLRDNTYWLSTVMSQSRRIPNASISPAPGMPTTNPSR